MNRRHQGRRRAGLVAAAGLTALIGTGALASPASAHQPDWSNTCSSVTVDLSQYNPSVKNTVEVKAAGQDIIPVTRFAKSFDKTVTLPDHTATIELELIVRAGDDRRDKHGWSVDEKASAPACQTTPPPTSPPPSSPPPSSPPPSTSASPTPSRSASPTPSHSTLPPTPVPSTSTPGTGLADTGASSATPVIAGVAAAVVLAGGALVLVSRKRRGGSH